MLKTLLTAFFTYIATSIDELPVLFLLYRKVNGQGRGKTVTLSYLLGTFILLTVSVLCSFGLGELPDRWLVGLIGLIPLIMGIKILVSGEEEEEEKAMLKAERHRSLWVQVLMVTIVLGADDLGVYIPLFTTLRIAEIVMMLFLFLIGTVLICQVSSQLTRIDRLKNRIESSERFITGTVFIAIGIMVLVECGTIGKIL